MMNDALLALSGSISGNTVTGQDVHATDNSVLSTNTVDLGTARDIGEGKDLFGRFEVTVAGTTGTSVEMQIIAADAANLTGNVAVIGTTGAILTAALTAGARFACRVNPRLASKGQQYIGARYVSVGAMAGITVYGDIGLEIQDGQKSYASGYAVL